MRKFFAALGTVLGFFGAAFFIFYFMMSPAQPFPLPDSAQIPPRNNLAADIAGNVPVFTGATTAAAILPETASSTSAAIAQTVATDTAPQTIAQPAAPTSTATTTPTTTAETIIETIPDATSEITASNGTVPDLPQATTTITVTPIAPPPPASLLSLSIAASQSAATSGIGLALPFHETNFANDNNWKATWGVSDATSNGYLRLAAAPTSIGGAVFLQNAASWSNYTMTATLDLAGGAAFGLMADYANASNYVACEYTKTGTDTIAMQLEQYVNGYESVLSPSMPVAMPTDLNASISITGVYGTCSLNGQTVSNEGIGPGKAVMSRSGNGSIGFTVSDATPGTSEIAVKEISVKNN